MQSPERILYQAELGDGSGREEIGLGSSATVSGCSYRVLIDLLE